MIEAVKKDKDIYLSNFAEFERQTADADPAWLQQLRKTSILRVAEFGFPTTRDEEWKYTNLSPMSRIPFRVAPAPASLDNRLRSHPLLNLPGPRLVLVNGHFSPELSSLDGLPPGLTVTSLSQAIRENKAVLQTQLGRYADPNDNIFNALNTAFLRDGAFVDVSPNMVVPTPISVVYVSAGLEAPFVTHPRNLFLVGSHSQVSLNEVYLGEEGAVYFTNPVTELVADDGATADHNTFQAEGPASYHIGTLRTYQRRSSTVRLNSLDLGGLLVRHNPSATLDGEGASTVLNGLYLGAGAQHIDNHTRIEHGQPHCDSRELYKGILTDSARAVFHGRIVVLQGAQKTDSKQTNNNLLLSDQALVNTKPQLEIYADDVKCTHGATVGRLEEEALFYLRSRGIDRRAASHLLIRAFAGEVIAGVRVDALRDEAEQYLASWLSPVGTDEGGRTRP